MLPQMIHMENMKEPKCAQHPQDPRWQGVKTQGAQEAPWAANKTYSPLIYMANSGMPLQSWIPTETGPASSSSNNRVSASDAEALRKALSGTAFGRGDGMGGVTATNSTKHRRTKRLEHMFSFFVKHPTELKSFLQVFQNSGVRYQDLLRVVPYVSPHK